MCSPVLTCNHLYPYVLLQNTSSHRHSLSFTCTHLYSLIPTCTHLNTHLDSPAHTCTHLFSFIPACTQIEIHVPTCTHSHSPVPTCHHMYSLIPTYTYRYPPVLIANTLVTCTGVWYECMYLSPHLYTQVSVLTCYTGCRPIYMCVVCRCVAWYVCTSLTCTHRSLCSHFTQVCLHVYMCVVCRCVVFGVCTDLSSVAHLCVTMGTPCLVQNKLPQSKMAAKSPSPLQVTRCVSSSVRPPPTSATQAKHNQSSSGNIGLLSEDFDVFANAMHSLNQLTEGNSAFSAE